MAYDLKVFLHQHAARRRVSGLRYAEGHLWHHDGDGGAGGQAGRGLPHDGGKRTTSARAICLRSSWSSVRAARAMSSRRLLRSGRGHCQGLRHDRVGQKGSLRRSRLEDRQGLCHDHAGQRSAGLGPCRGHRRWRRTEQSFSTAAARPWHGSDTISAKAVKEVPQAPDGEDHGRPEIPTPACSIPALTPPPARSSAATLHCWRRKSSRRRFGRGRFADERKGRGSGRSRTRRGLFQDERQGAHLRRAVPRGDRGRRPRADGRARQLRHHRIPPCPTARTSRRWRSTSGPARSRCRSSTPCRTRARPSIPRSRCARCHGAAMKSIGHTLYEDMKLDENGKCINANLTDYGAPMIGEAPEDFKSVLIDVNDDFGTLRREVHLRDRLQRRGARHRHRHSRRLRRLDALRPMTPEKRCTSLAGSERLAS